MLGRPLEARMTDLPSVTLTKIVMPGQTNALGTLFLFIIGVASLAAIPLMVVTKAGQ